MIRYEPIIGLEIHAELNTNSKMYCGCKNEFGHEANTLTCPICTGMPGTLPTLNSKAVEQCVKMGIALNCKVNYLTKQDRKNYFYPDLPKGYQITQHDTPICEDGLLEIFVGEATKQIGITRIHIEEDAGKIIQIDGVDETLIDYNRCGVPLIEIVSKPDLRSAEEAKAFLETIHATLLYVGICDGKMQEGNVRCDVNISLHPIGTTEYGTRCEIKNVNSFGAVYRGVLYEINRQTNLLKSGKAVEQQTLRWDDVKAESIFLRRKENSDDYRYFPEPDLPVFSISKDMVRDIKLEIPELPVAKTKRYIEQYSLSFSDAYLLAWNPLRSSFFEKAVEYEKKYAKEICNWIICDISAYLAKKNISLNNTKLLPENLSSMIVMIDEGVISNTAGKTVLEEMLVRTVDPMTAANEKNLMQINDIKDLNNIVTKVIEQNSKAVHDYINGKTNVLGFLVGCCMKLSMGRGNPITFTEILTDRLKLI